MRSMQAVRMLGLLAMASIVAPSQPGAQSTPAVDCRRSIVPEVAVAPRFPELARKARLSSSVLVGVSIGRGGQVTAAELRSENFSGLGLGDAAKEAANRWRFNQDSRCGERDATLRFNFRPAVPRGWGSGSIFKPPFEVEIVEEEFEVYATP